MALTKIDDRGLKTPIDLQDNEKIRLGTGNDLEVFHDGSDSKIVTSTGDLWVQTTADDLVFKAADDINFHPGTTETGLLIKHDAGVELYYDNSKKFATYNGGVEVFGDCSLGDSRVLNVGTGSDLQLYHSGSHSYIKNTTGNLYITAKSDEDGIIVRSDGAVELYHNNAARFSTESYGVNIIGDARWGDGRKATFGNDGTDLQIYHDGSHSYIKDSGTGQLRTQSNAFSVENAAGNENMIFADENGPVTLYHDSSAKLATSAAGVTVTGTVSDSKGNLRSIPQLNKSASYTLIASDAGKHITTNSGITVNPNVLSVGDAVTIINASGSDITITQGSSQTIYNTADASTGNRTLGARGMATMLFTSANTCYISGAGLS